LRPATGLAGGYPTGIWPDAKDAGMVNQETVYGSASTGGSFFTNCTSDCPLGSLPLFLERGGHLPDPFKNIPIKR